MTPPWGTVFVEHLPPSHPGFIHSDVLALLNSNEKFWIALERVEIEAVTDFVGWYRAKAIEYADAVDAEEKAWAYYNSLPLTHPNKSLAQANANALRAIREETANELKIGTAAGVKYVRNLYRLVQLRGFTMADLHDSIISGGLGNRPSVTRGLRERNQIGDFLGGVLDGIGGALRGRDPLSLTPGSTGGAGPFDELINSRFGGGPGGGSWLSGVLNGPGKGGRIVSSASGPHGSAPGGGGAAGGSGNPNPRDFGSGAADQPTGGESASAGGDHPGQTTGVAQGPGERGGSPSTNQSEQHEGGGYVTRTYYDANGNPVRTVESKKRPNPTGDPQGPTGNPLVDSADRRHARFQASFFAAPLGPSRALRPDSDSGFGTPSQADIDAAIALDPLAPWVNPTGTDYEGRRHYPPRAIRSGRSRYIEALYPDGDPQADERPALVAEPRQPPPDSGDPHALVRSVTAGVTSPSVNVMASRMSAQRRAP